MVDWCAGAVEEHRKQRADSGGGSRFARSSRSRRFAGDRASLVVAAVPMGTGAALGRFARSPSCQCVPATTSPPRSFERESPSASSPWNASSVAAERGSARPLAPRLGRVTASGLSPIEHAVKRGPSDGNRFGIPPACSGTHARTHTRDVAVSAVFLARHGEDRRGEQLPFLVQALLAAGTNFVGRLSGSQ